VCLTCANPAMQLSNTGRCYSVCTKHQFLAGNSCVECSASCDTCTGSQTDNCSSCADGKILVQGSCVDDCPADLTILDEANRTACRNRASVTAIVWATFFDFKCSYLMMASFIVLTIAKLTCLRKLGLLMSLVATAANFEAIALFIAIFNIWTSPSEEYLSALELSVYSGAPLVIAAVFLLLNICVTMAYLRATKKAVEGVDTSKESPDQRACGSLAVAALFAITLSFHNTAWLNICGQLALESKRRLFHHRFSELYTRMSRLSIILPRVFVQLYAVFFGVFQAIGKV